MSRLNPWSIGAIFLLLILSLVVWANRQILLALGEGIWETQIHSHSTPETAGNFPRFTEIQQPAGIEFRHFDSPRDSLLPEDVGSGAGWADYDNDGDEDLYLVNFAGPFLADEKELRQRPGNRLYRNDGDGRFTDVTRASGLGHVGWDYGVLWFDYDNDGSLDLAISHYEGILLYRNRGDGSFEETTDKARLSEIRRFLLGMTAGDYDLDGDLDLYLCGYVTFDREKARHRPIVSGRPSVWTNPVSYPAESNLLLQNNGDGTFTDVTSAAGVANPKGKSMQALFCDFDNDRYADLFVTNDVGTADALFHNNRDGTFTNVALKAGMFDPRGSMGIATGDLWQRGMSDLISTHWVAEDHAVWKNLSLDLKENTQLAFEDVGVATGIVAAKPSAYVGWGIGLYDFDNDGNLDLMIGNGSTIEDELTIDVLTDPKLIPQPAQLLWNRGDARFESLNEKSGPFFAKNQLSRGIAFADFDRDGGIDAAVIALGGQVTVLHNTTRNRGHWIAVQLVGTKSNRFGVGARVTVTADGRRQSRQRVLGTSYLSSDTMFCHFGLGQSSEAESIEVRWPSGEVTQLGHVAADKIITIREGM